MSLGTILGIIVSFTLLLGAIGLGTDSYRSFFSLEGLFIVIGGTLANAFMSYQPHYVMMALKAIWQMSQKPFITHEDMASEIRQIIEWAQLNQQGGLRGLEIEVDSRLGDEPLLHYGLELVISGYSPAEIRHMMEIASDGAFERRTMPVTVLRNMGGTAPAFGMVGTLVGMVIMLGHLEADMSGLGKGLAMALLATLYGVASARLIYLPAAEKLLQKEEMMRFRNHLITEGLVALAENQNHYTIRDKLNSFLDPQAHLRVDEDNKDQKIKPSFHSTKPLRSHPHVTL